MFVKVYETHFRKSRVTHKKKKSCEFAEETIRSHSLTRKIMRNEIRF